MSTTSRSALEHLSQRRATEAALANEYVTRGRVAAIEREIKETFFPALRQIQSDNEELLSVRYRGLWGRLRWLVLGK